MSTEYINERDILPLAAPFAMVSESIRDEAAQYYRTCVTAITHVRDRPGHDRRYAINPTKIRRRLGFAPSETLQSGLARTVDWYLAHEPWWRAVTNGSYRQWMAAHYDTRA